MNYNFAKVNGTKIHYQLLGDGPTLVFLHAGVADSRMWNAQVVAFKQQYQVLRLDMRDQGFTDSPEGDYYAHEDVKALLDYLGIEKATFIGCSKGGRVSINVALTYPEMVSGLVLSAPSLDGIERSGYHAKTVERDKIVDDLYDSGDWAECARKLTEMWFDGPFRSAETNPNPARILADEMSHHFIMREDDNKSTELILDPPAAQRLHEINVPVLLVWGDKDEPVMRPTMDYLSAELPTVTEVTIPNSGHLPALERPEMFNQFLNEFLSRL